MNTQKQIFLIVVLFFTMVGGCAAYTIVDIPVRAVDQAKWHKDQSIERGALLFANNCRTCHGIQGEGGVGLALNADSPRDFQNQDPLVLANNKALLKRTLYCGRATTRMPAWLNTNGGSLNERQIEHLIDLITAPADTVDEEGNPISRGWLEAIEFAHNLNHETVVVVGGDTLDTIAKDHQLGVAELVAANGNRDPDDVLPRNTKVQLPVAVGRPKGVTFTVHKDNETLRKIADLQHVGALLIADLNKIPYEIDEKNVRLTLKESAVSRPEGLIPFTQIALPPSASYVIKAGDTAESIATQHGLTESALDAALAEVEIGDDDVLVAERKLELPQNAVAVVQTGQTGSTIATAHGIEVTDLQTEAGVALTEESAATIGAGQRLKLPADTKYTIQSGDTLAAVAAGHGMSEADLAQLNDLQPGERISPLVVIQIPKVDKYTVAGQTLEDVAAGYSNVTAETLAEANPPAQPNSIFAIGTILKLPEDAWGSAPPDAINNGSACVQHAVPDSVYESLVNPAPDAEKPAEQSTDVEIVSNANDWTLTADGTEQAPNKGVALISVGTSVHFLNAQGIHTITINGDKDRDFAGPNQEADITFDEAGTFKITCDVHPAMLATLFVE